MTTHETRCAIQTGRVSGHSERIPPTVLSSMPNNRESLIPVFFRNKAIKVANSNEILLAIMATAIHVKSPASRDRVTTPIFSFCRDSISTICTTFFSIILPFWRLKVKHFLKGVT